MMEERYFYIFNSVTFNLCFVLYTSAVSLLVILMPLVDRTPLSIPEQMHHLPARNTHRSNVSYSSAKQESQNLLVFGGRKFVVANECPKHIMSERLMLIAIAVVDLEGFKILSENELGTGQETRAILNLFEV